MSHTPGARPGVEVEQEFVEVATTLGAPLLPTVIVGIVRQLEEDLDAGDYDARTGGANEVAGVDLEADYPSLIAGSAVEADTVTVSVQNTYGVFPVDSADFTANSPVATKFTVDKDLDFTHTMVATSSTGSFAGTATLTDANAKFITRGVLAGDDVVIVTGSLAPLTVQVVSVTSQTAIVTSFAGPFVTESNIQYSITRTEKLYGTVLVSYHAIRSDLNDELVTISTDSEIEDELGPIHPDNEGAFAMSKARLNAGTQQVMFTGVNADTVAEHTRALEFLESKEVYGIVPLSQDTSVLQLYQAHVDAMSTAQNKRERVAWLNRELVVREERIALTAGRTGTFTFATAKFTDSVGTFNFSNNGVVPGDFVIIDDSGTIRELLVQTVGPTVNEVTINVPGSVNYPAGNLVAVAYQILGPTKTKSEQASYLAAYSSAFANRRIRVVWPDIALADVDGVSTEVPGYHLSAASAGLRSGQRPQQPLTNLSLAGFDGLVHSNKYFSETQLQTLSAGGMFIIEQPINGAPLNIRQQRTTDTSSVKKNEDSVVAIVDHVSKYIRQELLPYIGRYNITPEYIEMIKVVINGLFERLKQSTSSGPEILSGRLLSIVQNAVDLDHLDVVLEIEAPIPANFIRVTLRV